MTHSILICTDLDRTLIPNGDKPLSAGAQDIFTELCQSDTIKLCYVTGRNYQLTKKAIEEYQLPLADFLICDVGASMHILNNQQYSIDKAWSDEIESDWNGMNMNLIQELLDDITDLEPQKQEHISYYKLSYFSQNQPDHSLSKINERLNTINVNVNIISSYDEIEKVFLIDILPRSVSKLHAINFLMEKNGDTYDNTIFCGDSGNDLDVFTSGIPSVIVKNAHQDIIDKINEYESSNIALNLYKANGGFHSLNGYYVSGILEGLAHYHTDLKNKINEIIKKKYYNPTTDGITQNSPSS